MLKFLKLKIQMKIWVQWINLNNKVMMSRFLFFYQQVLVQDRIVQVQHIH